jgi:hypothetical protein
MELMPGSAAVVDMVPDAAGRFEFECSASDHFNGGMVASFLVRAAPAAAARAAAATAAAADILPSPRHLLGPEDPDGGRSPAHLGLRTHGRPVPPPALAGPPATRVSAPPAGRVREYFVAAEEEEWDYAPSGASTVTPADGFMMSDPEIDFFGRTRYLKARYVEYADATFSARKPVAEEWRHAGILGPVLRAEVGDKIRVRFLNRASRPCSIRPHGLSEPAGEGISFRGDTGGVGGGGDAAAPGAQLDYVFDVPERAGPGPGDGSSVAWLYYSDIDHVADANTGLLGVIIVARAGAAAPDARPLDVDKEFVALFSVSRIFHA